MPFRSLTARKEYVTENKEKMEVPDTFGPKSDDFAPQVSACFDVRHQSMTSIFSLFSATYSNCSLRWRSKRHVSPGGGQAHLSLQLSASGRDTLHFRGNIVEAPDVGWQGGILFHPVSQHLSSLPGIPPDVWSYHLT